MLCVEYIVLYLNKGTCKRTLKTWLYNVHRSITLHKGKARWDYHYCSRHYIKGKIKWKNCSYFIAKNENHLSLHIKIMCIRTGFSVYRRIFSLSFCFPVFRLQLCLVFLTYKLSEKRSVLISFASAKCRISMHSLLHKYQFLGFRKKNKIIFSLFD